MKLFVQAAIAATATVVFCTSAFAEPVGNASSIIPNAQQTEPQGTRSDLKLRDQIIRNAELATADKGALEVTFLDGSRLTMGQNSRLTVDEYVYSGPGGTGKQTIRYTKGLFRFISGSIPKDQVKIETPTVTIGIRGTILRTAILEGGGGFVSVDYGPNGEEYDVYVKSKKTGESETIHSGQKIGFDGNGDFQGITDGTIEGCQ